MKVSELEGAALEYWFLKATGRYEQDFSDISYADFVDYGGASDMCGWSEVGPLIESVGIAISPHVSENGVITSWASGGSWPGGKLPELCGDNPRMAIMRCVVSMKFGEEVPDLTLPASAPPRAA